MPYKTPVAMSPHRRFLPAWGLLSLIVGSAALPAGSRAAVADSFPAAQAAAPEAAAGTWRRHEYSFRFLGFTSTYSCDGLADKLRDLLLAAGARPDVKASPGACAEGFGRPDKLASARLVFYTLGPPGDPAVDGQPVTASWHPVLFSTRSPRTLERGDCELVEQFGTSVLPMFTTRNVTNHTTCVPHQDTGSVINLRFEALTAVLVTSHHLIPSHTAP